MGAGERFRLHRALRALVEELARERPVVLVVDDLHWVDEASVEWLLHLLRRAPAGAHLVAFASRPVDPLARVLDAARQAPGFEALALEPLGHEESLRLLADVRDPRCASAWPRRRREPALPARARPCRGSRGRRAAGYAVGGGRVEVGALEPGASRALVRGAAVVGDPFDPELAAAAAGMEPDAGARRLVRADLVRASPTAARSRSAIRWCAARSTTAHRPPGGWPPTSAPPPRSSGAAGGGGARLPCGRFAIVGDEAAIALLSQAAATAAGTGPDTAAHWYGAALRLVPEADPERRAALLAPLALALAGAGRLADSREALSRRSSCSTPRRRRSGWRS